jgi:peptide/nickel transport system substrate-binding protein
MRRRAHLRFLMGAAAFAILAAGCSGGDGAAEDSSPDDTTTTADEGDDGDSGDTGDGGATGGTLVVAEDGVPVTFDPTQSALIKTSFVWQWVYESLVEVKPDGSIEPLLATEWETSDDGLTYTFTLREGVTFHNGEPFEADDVVFTFERLMDVGVPYATGRFPTFESVEATDGSTVVFTLSEPDSGFLNNHGNPFMFGAAILNREAADTVDFATEMVGTGPFKWESYDPDRELRLSRFEDYWRDGIPKADGAVVRYMPEQSAQVAALKRGEIDVMFPSAETFLSLKDEPNLQIETVSSSNVIRLNIAGNPPFDDERVRQALALAIDREEIVNGAMLGAGTPAGYVPPAYDWATPVGDLPHHTQDIERAKELLAEAGYEDGFDIEISHLANYGTYMDRYIEILQSQLEQIGITSTIISREITTWQDFLVTADYDITPNEFSFQPDPYWYVVPRDGRQGPTPPELEELLAKSKTASAEELPDVINEIEMWEAEHVYPDLSIAARDQWVVAREGVNLGTPEFSLSRRFLFETAPPS